MRGDVGRNQGHDEVIIWVFVPSLSLFPVICLPPHLHCITFHSTALFLVSFPALLNHLHS